MVVDVPNATYWQALRVIRRLAAKRQDIKIVFPYFEPWEHYETLANVKHGEGRILESVLTKSRVKFKVSFDLSIGLYAVPRRALALARRVTEKLKAEYPDDFPGYSLGAQETKDR